VTKSESDPTKNVPLIPKDFFPAAVEEEKWGDHVENSRWNSCDEFYV